MRADVLSSSPFLLLVRSNPRHPLPPPPHPQLLGIWFVASWMGAGKPPAVRLVELGPGRGTLMADMLRAVAKFPDLQAVLEVHFVETSPTLRLVLIIAFQSPCAVAGATTVLIINPLPPPSPQHHPGAGGAGTAASRASRAGQCRAWRGGWGQRHLQNRQGPWRRPRLLASAHCALLRGGAVDALFFSSCSAHAMPSRTMFPRMASSCLVGWGGGLVWWARPPTRHTGGLWAGTF